MLLVPFKLNSKTEKLFVMQWFYQEVMKHFRSNSNGRYGCIDSSFAPRINSKPCISTTNIKIPPLGARGLIPPFSRLRKPKSLLLLLLLIGRLLPKIGLHRLQIVHLTSQTRSTEQRLDFLKQEEFWL